MRAIAGEGLRACRDGATIGRLRINVTGRNRNGYRHFGL
jgi:hypothetical protein